MDAVVPPFFRTPATDLQVEFGPQDIQKHGTRMCKKFEMKFYSCMEAYGLHKGYEKCSDLYQDMQECKHRDKQNWRVDRLQEERLRQIKAGKQTYIPPPPEDLFYTV